MAKIDISEGGIPLREYVERLNCELRNYFERVFKERDTALEVRFEAQSTALQLANETLGERLHTLNEYKANAERKEATYLLRIEYEGKHNFLVEKIDALERLQAAREGALKILLPASAIFGGIVGGGIGALTAHLLK